MIRDTSYIESNTLYYSDIGIVQILGIVREKFSLSKIVYSCILHDHQVSRAPKYSDYNS